MFRLRSCDPPSSAGGGGEGGCGGGDRNAGISFGSGRDGRMGILLILLAAGVPGV
jgi:hypothetical protein